MKLGPVAGKTLKEIEEHEESLWRAQTRFDDVLMDQKFAPDFEEFGRSGRRYRRDEMFFGTATLGKIPARLPLRDFAARWLSEDTALTTYTSEVDYSGGIKIANRSSIWSRSDGDWQLRFHQSTPKLC